MNKRGGIPYFFLFSLHLKYIEYSIDFVDIGSTTRRSGTTRETSTTGETFSTRGNTTSSLVNSHHNGVEEIFKLFLLGSVFFSFSLVVGLKPFGYFINKFLDILLLISLELVLELLVLEGVSDGVGVVFESVLSFDLLLEGFVLSLEFLSFLDETVDFFLGKTTLLVGNGDLVGLGSTFISSGNVEDTVLINIEGDFNLRNTSGSRGNSVEIEFTEEMVVLGHGSFTFEDLNEDTRLVFSVGGEGLRLLSGDGGVTGDENSHDLSGSFDTHGKRGNVEKEDILDVFRTRSSENSGLDSSTVSDGFIGVDGSVRLLSVEEIGNQLDDLGDTGGTTDKNDFVDGVLSHTRVLNDLLYRGDTFLEHGKAEFLELRTRDLQHEVN